MAEQPRFATGDGLQVMDASNPAYLRLQGEYLGNGFVVPGKSRGIAALATEAANLTRVERPDADICMGYIDSYYTLYDASRPTEIGLLDALWLNQGCPSAPLYTQSWIKWDWWREPLLMTEEGIAVLALPQYVDRENYSVLDFVDTLTQDLVSSSPAEGERGIAIDTPITLRFTRALPDLASLASYVALYRDDGSSSAVAVPFTLEMGGDTRTLVVRPSANLNPDSDHRLVLSGQLASRRTVGLFDHEIRFVTGSGTGAPPTLVEVSPKVLEVTGGTLYVTLADVTSGVQFTLSGDEAPVVGQQVLGDGSLRFELQAPPQLPGPAKLQATTDEGAIITRIGAVYYVEPLVVNGISPQQGSIAGGNKVRIKGQGLRSDDGQIQVAFGAFPADANGIKVLDAETLEVVVPGGAIGTVDVVVTLGGNQQGTLAQAYTYLQPVQASIESPGRIYDLVLDPSGSFLIAAQGAEGVSIYDINASNLTTQPQDPLNLDDLVRMVDQDGDKVDDRILTRVKLPDGFMAVGVAPYFEKGSDRLFVTGVRLAKGEPREARLFVIAFDSVDITNSTLIRELALPSAAARGIHSVNNRVVVAMGEAGLGIADTHLHSKIYLSNALAMPDDKPLLDVAPVNLRAGENSRYVAVGGAFDYAGNRLIETEKVGGGGFYLIEQGAGQGLRVLASLDISCKSTVVMAEAIFW
jgi:hypothetical protein